MYESKDHTVEAIAHTIGVSRKTVYRHLAPRGCEGGLDASDGLDGRFHFCVLFTSPPQRLPPQSLTSSEVSVQSVYCVKVGL